MNKQEQFITSNDEHVLFTGSRGGNEIDKLLIYAILHEVNKT